MKKFKIYLQEKTIWSIRNMALKPTFLPSFMNQDKVFSNLFFFNNGIIFVKNPEVFFFFSEKLLFNIVCILFTVKRVVFLLYSGREQISRYLSAIQKAGTDGTQGHGWKKPEQIAKEKI